MPWAIKDRCGKDTGSGERGGVHIINLNFTPFTGLVNTEAFAVPFLHSLTLVTPKEKIEW